MKHAPATDRIHKAMSPPARGRGLKLDLRFDRVNGPVVAPRTGAWIET